MSLRVAAVAAAGADGLSTGVGATGTGSPWFCAPAGCVTQHIATASTGAFRMNKGMFNILNLNDLSTQKLIELRRMASPRWYQIGRYQGYLSLWRQTPDFLLHWK
jgi:hypothetical protein